MVGPQHDPSNYRPISVVPVTAKTLEKIVANQLNQYFKSNKLLSPFQGAYRQGKSTEQILLYAVDTIVMISLPLFHPMLSCMQMTL